MLHSWRLWRWFLCWGVWCLLPLLLHHMWLNHQPQHHLSPEPRISFWLLHSCLNNLQLLCYKGRNIWQSLNWSFNRIFCSVSQVFARWGLTLKVYNYKMQWGPAPEPPTKLVIVLWTLSTFKQVLVTSLAQSVAWRRTILNIYILVNRICKQRDIKWIC